MHLFHRKLSLAPERWYLNVLGVQKGIVVHTKHEGEFLSLGNSVWAYVLSEFKFVNRFYAGFDKNNNCTGCFNSCYLGSSFK